MLQRRCDEVGRDYATIEKTATAIVTPATTRDDLRGWMDDAHKLGYAVLYLAPATPRPFEVVELLASVAEEAAALS